MELITAILVLQKRPRPWELCLNKLIGDGSNIQNGFIYNNNTYNT